MMKTSSQDSYLQLIQLKQMDELASIISQLEQESPETLRLLACGILEALECRLGGQCYCGKLIEERDILDHTDALVQALVLCRRNIEERDENDRQKVINQIYNQWPDGLLIADTDVKEGFIGDDTFVPNKSAAAG